MLRPGWRSVDPFKDVWDGNGTAVEATETYEIVASELGIPEVAWGSSSSGAVPVAPGWALLDPPGLRFA